MPVQNLTNTVNLPTFYSGALSTHYLDMPGFYPMLPPNNIVYVPIVPNMENKSVSNGVKWISPSPNPTFSRKKSQGQLDRVGFVVKRVVTALTEETDKKKVNALDD
ncbi:hypothetical protein K501DRAFT_278399 [Backusella circina FSU 941]|nr:hypothetical protein K501DRAFT_278399 [Backusella circina FSU 941]